MEMILRSGPVIKLSLLVLAYLSVVSWAIIFFKFRVIRRAIRDSLRFQNFFWAKKRLDLVSQGLKNYQYSPLTVLFRDGYQEILRHQTDPNGKEQSLFSTDLGQSANVGRALRRAMTQERQRLEKFLTFLATTGSIAPFIGLFGTIWGIMDAFISIGQTGSTSLAVIAPGISEALVTTAIGLVAAIPAVVAYNHFVNKVNLLAGEMDSFSQEFLNIVQRMPRRN